MGKKGEHKWRVGLGAVLEVCDLLASYYLASLIAQLFLLADSQPTRHFCYAFLPIGYKFINFNAFIYYTHSFLIFFKIS